MKNLRTAIIRLPFASENPDGTLNFWDVTPSGNKKTDTETGRRFLAWLLHVVREYEAPHLLFHVGIAWNTRTDGSDHDIRAGWTFELTDALLAAAPNCPQMASVACKDYVSDDLRESMLRLPFVTERADGSLNCFDVNFQEEYSAAQARGRFYAALTAKFIQDTRHPSFLAVLALGVPEQHRDSAIRVGFLCDLMEIAVSGHWTATPQQAQVYPFYKEAVRAAA